MELSASRRSFGSRPELFMMIQEGTLSLPFEES